MRKIIGKKNKVHYVEETTRFQMVKSHKGWLVIGASMFALGLGVLVTSQPVSADVVATSTSSSAVRAETTDASSSNTVKAETTDASSSSAVKAETTDASSSSAVKTETTSASGASDAKSVVQPMADNTAVLTNVTKDNFEDYFSLNGSATYDQTTGIVTITPDENNKVGNFSLNSKIDMNSSFTLTGQVNIGNKTSSQGGADGVGFAFHNGNTTDVGNAGGNLGIGNLQEAIGFKLDTYHNGYKTPQANEDGAQVASIDSDGYGTDPDPDGTQFPQFGAFVNTSQKLVQAQDGNSYSRWWATTDINSVQKLNSGDLDGQFHNFVVSYDGSNRNLTIKYTETGGNVLTWSTSIPSAYQAMAMVVSASTGGNKNLQQFKISSFDFKQAATVNVKYVDQKGNRLAQGTVSYPSGANVNGTYTTGQLEIPNYKFVRMDDGTATGAKSLPATGTLTKAEDNGTVIYVYAPAYTQTSKTISETIKYIDQDGKEVAKGYTADPITFVTVTNPVDNTTTTYYSTKAKTATLDDNGVPTEAGWTKADSTDFAEVVNPEVDGYKVISNDAPNSDLTNVAVQTVYTNSSDLDFTVVYAKNAPTITTESKTINETIHYVYKDGTTAHDDYVAKPVEFTREVSTDAVTGEKTYGSWSADQSFDAVTSPAIKGYTPDQAEIDKQIVNGDSKDLEFKVTYTKTPVAGGNVTAKYVDENGNPIADDVIASGNVGDPYSTTQKDVPGYTFKEVQGNPTGSFTDQDQTVTYVYTKNPATDNNGGTGPNRPGKPGNGTDTGNSSSNQPGNTSQPSNAANNGVINTSTNTGSKVNNGAVNSPELPQTGENNSQSQTMSFIGILLAMFGSLLGFLGVKKRRNN